MKNQFMTNEEYERFFFDFEGIRGRIADALTPYGLKKAKWILDIPTGHGLLSHEVALLTKENHLIGVGLSNDINTFATTRSLPEFHDTLKRVAYVECDSTTLGLVDDCLDLIVNFLGLEDIHMTRGERGVAETFSECARVLQPGGILQVAVCIEGDEPDEILSKEVIEFIGHGALFKQKDFYVDQFDRNGIQILEEQWQYSQKKLTAKQAQEELQFTCEQTPRIFRDFEVSCRPFTEVWAKFGERIEEIGLACYSDICMLIGEKESD